MHSLFEFIQLKHKHVAKIISAIYNYTNECTICIIYIVRQCIEIGMCLLNHQKLLENGPWDGRLSQTYLIKKIYIWDSFVNHNLF